MNCTPLISFDHPICNFKHFTFFTASPTNIFKFISLCLIFDLKRSFPSLSRWFYAFLLACFSLLPLLPKFRISNINNSINISLPPCFSMFSWVFCPSTNPVCRLKQSPFQNIPITYRSISPFNLFELLDNKLKSLLKLFHAFSISFSQVHLFYYFLSSISIFRRIYNSNLVFNINNHVTLKTKQIMCILLERLIHPHSYLYSYEVLQGFGHFASFNR